MPHLRSVRIIQFDSSLALVNVGWQKSCQHHPSLHAEASVLLHRTEQASDCLVALMMRSCYVCLIRSLF